MIDGAQQCSVLQVISGDIDGIHRPSCCAGFGCCRFFSLFSCLVCCWLLCEVTKVFTIIMANTNNVILIVIVIVCTFNML